MRKIPILILTIFFCLNGSWATQAQNLMQYEKLLHTHFKDYVAHFPNFNIALFEPGKTRELALVKDKYLIGDWTEYIAKFKPFIFFNNDRSWGIDILSANADVTLKDGVYFGDFDVDQAVLLGDFREKKVYELTFCGSSCRYVEAYWINDYQVFIVGYFSQTKDYNPMITVIDITRRTITSFYSDGIIAPTAYLGSVFGQIK